MSIEWAMWFALGFLSAGILALLLMTAVWRRAVRLTTRRVRAAVPAGVDAVRAEADLLRARHAREGRRFELALADLRHRNAEERLEAGRWNAEADRLRGALEAENGRREAAEADIETLMATVDGLETRVAGLSGDLDAASTREIELRTMLDARDATITRMSEDHLRSNAETAEVHGAAVAELEARHRERVDGLEETIDEARAENEARKTTIASFEEQARSFKLQLAEAAARLEEARRTRGLAETTAEQEKDRADRLDRRIARLVADVADREERVERLARELERSRQAVVFANARANAATAGGSGEAVAADGDLLASLEQSERRNRELEDRLASTARAETRDGAIADAPTRAELRRSLAELAAEIVHLSALAEGPTSPIARIVAKADGSDAGLADRIRELRRRASAADTTARM